MPEPHWQKSTYSQEASACVYVATAPAGTILLRESDDPHVILTTGPRQLGALISTLRSTQRAEPPRMRGLHVGRGPLTAG
ncbi:DUF397 domain-containing protein [Streptomyces sp. NPDC005574]|uniref:DUF397 domain-containing protein n=1 Tax=Streptomyces sp. NPDC005574 TaxID=3156891 RepID=UPI0033A45EF1